jgi:hypothetical protein
VPGYGGHGTEGQDAWTRARRPHRIDPHDIDGALIRRTQHQMHASPFIGIS